ncbi:putative exported protein [Sphingomonas paucimobilis]|nr:putative exported protein [Sphingomonas paucimobilis]
MTVRRHLLFAALNSTLLLSATALAQEAQPSVKDRARSAVTASRARTGSSDALQSNYVTPGLSGQTITTVDGKTGFTANLSCQKTSTLLELLVQPGSTGDLTQVRISHDRDFDGSFDSQTLLPVPVSGICANGVIACNPGTWEGCRYYGWSVDSARNINLAQTQMTSLSGCYCINNSCGTNLAWGNISEVLKDLGGGVVGALTTADPRIGVAQAEVEGTMIRYTGAQTTSCTAQPEVSATRYRSSPTDIQGDAYSLSQASSVFQALAGSAAGSGKTEQVRNCSIEREVAVKEWSFDDIVAVRGSVTKVTSCGTDCRRYEIRGSGSCGSVPPIYSATFEPLAPARIKSARIVEMGADDWVQARVNGQIVGYAGKRPWLGEALPSGDCRISDDPWYNRTAIDITSQLTSGTTVVGARVRGGGGGNWGYVTLEVQVDTGCETSERLVDLCSAYGADPQCRLKSESVDDVVTFSNGVGTGLSPLPQTRTMGTGTCAVQLTRDFFLKERRYACIIDTGNQASPDLSRAAYIIDRSTETVLNDRIQKSDGSVQETSRAFSMPTQDAVAACEPICKTRKARTNSDAAVDGVVSQIQTSDQGWDSYYHVCSADNVCPAGDGEEIVSACGCLDDFPEAVTMMQTVRLAGADLVCTAGAQ